MPYRLNETGASHLGRIDLPGLTHPGRILTNNLLQKEHYYYIPKWLCEYNLLE